MKKLSLKTLVKVIAMVIVTVGSAQAQRSPVWLEGSVSLQPLFHLQSLNGVPFNASLGYNRFYNDRASWGVMLEYSQASQFNSYSTGHSTRSQLDFSLVPNLSLRYPINSFLSWTPRFYLSLGYHFEESWNTPTGQSSTFSQTNAAALELGARLASFDIDLSPHCAFNINVDPLGACLRLSAAKVDYEDNLLPLPLEAHIPFGQVREEQPLLGPSRPLCTVSFRYRF